MSGRAVIGRTRLLDCAHCPLPTETEDPIRAALQQNDSSKSAAFQRIESSAVAGLFPRRAASNPCGLLEPPTPGLPLAGRPAGRPAKAWPAGQQPRKTQPGRTLRVADAAYKTRMR